MTDRSSTGGTLYLDNKGVEASDYDVFSLTGQSSKIPNSEIPGAGSNQAVIDLRSVGVRFLPAAWPVRTTCEFAINTNGRRAHPAYPAGFEVDIDTNGDGVVDYFVFNGENGGFAVTGQTLVFVQKVGAAAGSAFFFADADLNSGNMIMTIPAAAIGVVAGQTITFSVYAKRQLLLGDHERCDRRHGLHPGQRALRCGR